MEEGLRGLGWRRGTEGLWRRFGIAGTHLNGSKRGKTMQLSRSKKAACPLPDPVDGGPKRVSLVQRELVPLGACPSRLCRRKYMIHSQTRYVLDAAGSVSGNFNLTDSRQARKRPHLTASHYTMTSKARRSSLTVVQFPAGRSSSCRHSSKKYLWVPCFSKGSVRVENRVDEPPRTQLDCSLGGNGVTDDRHVPVTPPLDSLKIRSRASILSVVRK